MAKKKNKTTPVDETEGEGGKKKKSKKKLMLVAVLVIVLGGGAFAYMSMGKKPMAAATGGPPTTVSGMLEVQNELTVNLRDGHYLEFTVALDVPKGQNAAILTADAPVVLDILNSQAAAMTEPQLLQPGGTAKLKASILRAMDQEWPGLVSAVYFEQFVMQ